MAYEAKDNSGTLFKNDRREKETHPHAKGKALIGGRWYWVSAWTKEGKNGRFQSLSFTEMTDEQADKEGGHRTADVPGFTEPRRAPARQTVPADDPFA